MKNRIGRNLLQTLSNNFGLKILALLIAAVLWFIITNINDPVERKPLRNIKVEIINEEALTDEGKVYEILENTAVIPIVYVSGKSSILDSITAEDIKATADLSEITFLNTVNIKVTSSRYSSDLTFSPSIDTLKLSVEDVKRTQMVINSSVIGSPADGYVIGSVTPSQNIVRISGPASLVESIDHVDAVANIGNYAYTSDINTSVDLILYDENGAEIDNSSIKLNISTINITVSILATKDVPFSVEVAGEPASGYKATSEPITSISTLKIAGKKMVLDNISSINIVDAGLDLTDVTSDYSTTINIKKMLPSGVTFADSTFDGYIMVYVPVEKIVTKKYDIPVSNFAIGHIPEGFEASIVELNGLETYGITFEGTSSDITNLKAKDIICVVDLEEIADEYGITEWEEGTYAADIHFNVDADKYSPTEKYALTIELVEQTD